MSQVLTADNRLLMKCVRAFGKGHSDVFTRNDAMQTDALVSRLVAHIDAQSAEVARVTAERDDAVRRWEDAALGYDAQANEVARLREALEGVVLAGQNDPDCNLCGEYLDARNLARAALAQEVKP